MNTNDRTVAVAAALKAGAILEDRTDATGHLTVRGADAESFLQGVLSQDVKGLAPGRHALSFLLTPKGAIVAILRVLRLSAGDFLASADAPAAAKAVATLLRYVVSEDVSVRDASADFAMLALRGARALDIADAVHAGTGGLVEAGRFISSGDTFAIRSGEPGLDGVDLLVPRARAAEAKAALAARGALAIGADVAQGLRVEAGIPRCGKDLEETSLGPESRLEAMAVSYTKGCFVGQETIARLKTYGQVNRLLVGLTFEGEPAKEGDAIVVDGKDVGRVTTVAAPAPRLGRPAALALLRREHVAPGTRVVAGSAPAVVASLPLVV